MLRPKLNYGVCIVWCERVIGWHDHVQRALIYNHPCARLLNYHDLTWLQHKRAEWVSEHDTRNTLLAGRTGTRATGGRPQMRWAQGLDIAKTVSGGRSLSIKGGNALTIGNRIREALISIRDAVTPSIE